MWVEALQRFPEKLTKQATISTHGNSGRRPWIFDPLRGASPWPSQHGQHWALSIAVCPGWLVLVYSIGLIYV